MALEPTDTLKKLLDAAKKPLLLLPEHPSGDAIASAWAVWHVFKNRNISATIAVHDPLKKRDQFSFLPTPEKILSSLAGSKDFVLIFNTENNPISTVKTDRREKELRIYLTPDKGAIDPRDFSFVPAELKYDLVVTFGCLDKESLGKLYEESADVLFEMPIVNIDYHSENENFGQVNIVDMTASSTSEVVTNTLLAIDQEALTENVAQCLLTGIISATDSFQQKNTTPQALHLSAKLIEHGADRQEIVKYLYKTQPLSIIKLWGRIMAKLRLQEDLNLVWAPVALEDFVQSRTDPGSLPDVLGKIKSNYALGKVFLLLYEQKSGATVSVVKAVQMAQVKSKLQKFDYTDRGDYIEVRMENMPMRQAEMKVLEALR